MVDNNLTLNRSKTVEVIFVDKKTLHALRFLRFQVLAAESLFKVNRGDVIAKLHYAASAW